MLFTLNNSIKKDFWNSKWDDCSFVSFVRKKDLDVNASDIANLLNISNARVAKLIIKLEKEKLTTKNKACMDSRMVILKITEKGRDVVVNKYRELMNFFNYLREEIGEEKLTQFYYLSKKK